MRTLILSDIHSNLEALQAVFKDAESRGGFEEIWSVGDIVGYGPDPGACLELLLSHEFLSVVGNHDLAAVGKLSTAEFNSQARIAAEWTASQLTPEHVRFLSSLPEVARRYDFTLVHGSLREPIWEYLVSIPSAMETFRLLESRFCLVGHSHIPFLCREGEMLCNFDDFPEDEAVRLDEERIIINPGGVGQPRDGDQRPSYAIYDSAEQSLYRHRVTYEIAATQKKMRAAELPEGLITRLDFGR